MAEPQSAVLSINKRIAKSLRKLDRGISNKVELFQEKFTTNYNANSLKFQRLGNSKLCSARVSDGYRAILLEYAPRQFMLIDVRKREEVYDRMEERYGYQVNEVTGAFEVIDYEEVSEAVRRVLPKPATEPTPARPKAEPETAKLFDPYTDQDLTDIGIAPPLFPAVRAVETDEQLEALVKALEGNDFAQEVLLDLGTGTPFDEVMEKVTEPAKPDEVIDTTDYVAAVKRPTSMVTSSDEAVDAMLDSGFDTWRLWLHPDQRQSVERNYNGPARVSGGPGTGKTVVALHRAKRLAEKLDSATNDKILFTTFTNNLANDLQEKLKVLGGAEVMDRVDVIGVDRLAYRLANENQPVKGKLLFENKLIDKWRDICLEANESDFDAEFLQQEWRDVITEQLITSRSEYFKARRVRRPRRLNRAQRARIWELTERFSKRLADDGGWCYEQLRASAALAEESRAESGLYRYSHVIVDEAQDLSAAHWRMLRALVPEGPNDMFIAGDTFQRIYGHPVTLGRLGINIVGRSTKLKLNYRTTREILQTALAIEDGQTVDDMDGSSESLAGYKSVVSGDQPVFMGAESPQAELDQIVKQVQEWTEEYVLHSVAITAPRREQVSRILQHLNDAGVPAQELEPRQAPDEDHVHVGTMHRLKGLEYRYLLISGVGETEFPYTWITPLEQSNPERYQLEMEKVRNLLFVAATRARDKVVFSWTGQPSPLLNRK